MELIRLLLRVSRRTVYISAAGGLVAGASTSLLLAQVDASVTRSGASSWHAFAALCIVTVAARMIAEIWMLRGIMDLIYDLRVRLCRQILGSPLSRLEAHGAPSLLAAVTEDVASISHGLPIMGLLVTDAMVVAMCLGYLAWMTPAGAAGLLAVVAIGVLICWRPLRRARRLDAGARQAQGALFDHLHMLVEGSRQLKLHRGTQAAFLDQALGPSAHLVRDRAVRARGWFSATDATGHALFFAILGAWIFIGPRLAPGEAAATSTPIILLLYLFMPLKRTLEHLPLLSQAAVALHTVTQLGMTLDARPDERRARATGPRSFTTLEMRGVVYQRDATQDRGFRLGPIDLTLRPGQVVFLIGGNGSGKSTLARVLTGLYPPSAGHLFLDGQPVREDTRESYRQLFAVVFSDHYLFPDLHARDPALDAEARRHMARLELGDRVDIEDSRFSTVELSSGQRKRLALAAALVEDRPFYVLDEWAAEQDPSFKELFYTEILSLLRERGKGVLVITHDDHYFHVADVILKLEEGRLSHTHPRVDPQS